jgi:TolB-like protein/tetratricopeptide (TPR) repeat protein
MSESGRAEHSSQAIFLSYASQDSAAAQAIFEALSAAGFEVWFDQSELRGGDAWDQKLRRQIKECALFIPIISAHTQTRAEGYFRLEWHLAEQRTYLMAHDQLFLLPVVVDDTPDSAARVPERFRERQWTRLRGGVTPPDFAERIRSLLAGSPVPAARPAAAPERFTSFATASAPAGPKEKSVAVLAFANLSDDKENEFFSDGVSEELLTVLQKIPGLRVAARTSAFSFKGKSATIQEIGAKLGVSHLVEGSVQKSGNRVKVTARLSRVANGEEQWSRSYTREVKDVFALQEELAVAIVGELRGHFGGADAATTTLVKAAAQGGTTNPQAHEEYLMGRHLVSQFSAETESRALAHFTRASELDPGYAAAWASLAQCHTWFCGYSGTLTREEWDRHLDAARASSARALALAPDLPQALASQFWLEFGYDFKWKTGRTIAYRALELAPSDPDVLLICNRAAMTVGNFSEGLDLARRAVAVDPMSAKSRVALAIALMVCGKFDEARQESRRVAELNPNSMFAKSGPGFVGIYEGKYAEAEQAVAGAGSEWHVLWVRAIACFGQGKMAEGDAALAELIAHNADTAAVQISLAYGFRGANDEAFAWLERSARQRDPGLCTLNNSPLFGGLREDPRWAPFWENLPSFVTS